MADKRKKNFTEEEIDCLLDEIEARWQTLFGSLNSGITTKGKSVAWQCVTASVNEVGDGVRTLTEVKKKWNDLKLQGKKRIAAHKASVKATGGGPAGAPELSPTDQRIASILGTCAVSGIGSHGDTECLLDEGEFPVCLFNPIK